MDELISTVIVVIVVYGTIFLFSALGDIIKKIANRKHEKEEDLKDYYNSCIKNKENELKKRQKDLEYQYNVLYQTQLSQLQEEFKKQFKNKTLEVLPFKKLHKMLLENCFLFNKTSIDDTLISKTRYKQALSDDVKLVSKPFIYSNTTDETGIVYETTLTDCNCEDFKNNHIPCKHMIKLAIHTGLINSNEEPAAELKQMERVINEHYVNQYEYLYKKCQQKDREIQLLIKEKSIKYPWLAKVFSDYTELMLEQRLSQTEKYTSTKTINILNEFKNKNTNLIKKCKELEYQLNFYNHLLPWIKELGISPIEIYEKLNHLNELEREKYKQITKEALSDNEIYNINKENWELGLEFERFIGYLYELKGYTVEYTGAIYKLGDMGRDLIAKNTNETLIIQCKRWSNERNIHEKHIFQLYGTKKLYELEHEFENVKAVFIATNTLTETARNISKSLDIEVQEHIRIINYPKIKCKITENGEKLYFTPTNNYYDRLQMILSNGDIYVSTIKEAEKLGFKKYK